MLELPQSRHMKVQPALAGSVAQVGMTALLVSAVLTGMLGCLCRLYWLECLRRLRGCHTGVWAAQAVLPESQVLGEPEALLAWMVLQGAGSRIGNRRHCWS